MGYFVQIIGETGSPVFQAVKNYQDVSFASSTLFHGLVIASLEQGFMPSVLRAQDVTIALAVHGVPGCRLSITLVTSEFAAGQTRDLEAQLQWRLSAVYHGAVLAAGSEFLMREIIKPQPAELRRLLAERLSPIVTRLMAEEVVPGLCSRVPCLGMATSGAAVEWLPGCAADAEFQRLVGSLPAGGGAVLAGLSPTATSRAMAVLAWQGRVVAATAAWRSLDPVYRALLLALADNVGPASFESPSRSWALEEMEHLWLPSDTGATGTRYRMLSVRLYPGQESLGCSVGKAGDQIQQCNDGSETLRHVFGSPSADECASLWSDEASLVFSVLEPEGGHSGARLSAADLQQSADLCGGSLQDLWTGLRSDHRLGEAEGVVAMLLDEHRQEVVVIPSVWHTSNVLPWQCSKRQEKVNALRRLTYWLHALPPLGPNREQHYACCEDYALAAARREDGLQCWGVSQHLDGGEESSILRAVTEILRRVPASVEVRNAFVG